MECRAVVSSLSDYLDGRNIWASDDEVERIETHLTNCPTCLNLKLELTELKNAARELPLHNPPPALWRKRRRETIGETWDTGFNSGKQTHSR